MINIPIGKRKNSSQSAKSSYESALAAVAVAVDDARAKLNSDPPLKMSHLVIEDAFALFEATTCYAGLDEEAVTASFVTCLAASASMWRRQWVWQNSEDYELVWTHMNARSETATGADFVLVIAAEDGNFNLIVAQAKSIKTAGSKKLDVRRAATRGGLTDNAEANASLLRAMRDQQRPTDVDVTAPDWQLARLLHLRRDMIREVGAEAIENAFLYVAWPPLPGKAVRRPVTYVGLSGAVESVGANNVEEDGSLTQSFSIQEANRFRELLLQATEKGSLKGKTIAKLMSVC